MRSPVILALLTPLPLVLMAACSSGAPVGQGGSGPTTSSSSSTSSTSSSISTTTSSTSSSSTTSSSTTSSSTGGGGAGGSPGTGGAGGMGGIGGIGGTGGAGMGCIPGSTKVCYAGPAGTLGVGVCQAGVQTCDASGSGYGACVGEILPAAENCATSADEDCDGSGAATCAAVLWAKQAGDALTQAGRAVQVGPAGQVAVAGRCQGTFDFGGGALVAPAGAFDICLAVLDSAGNHLWSRQLSAMDEVDDRAPSLAFTSGGDLIVTAGYQGSVDPGGGVLLSAGQSDIVVARYSATGEHLWSKSYGGVERQISEAVAVDTKGTGDILLTGLFKIGVSFGGGLLSSAGATDLFLTRLDGAGNHLWSKRCGDGSDQVGSGVAFDPSGNIVLAGFFDGTIDLGGGPLVATAGSFDLFAAKLDGAGNHLWSKKFAGPADEEFVRLALGPAGEVFLTTFSSGDIDFGGGSLPNHGGKDVFLAKLDGAGNHLWSKRFGDAAGQLALGVATSTTGDVFLTGAFQGALDLGNGPLLSAGLNDVFVARFSPAGTPLWSSRFGDAAVSQSGADIAVDSSGAVFVTGGFGGTLDFGSSTLVSAGGTDLWVAKLAP